MTTYDWVITETVTVRQIMSKGESHYLIYDDDVRRAVVLTLHGDRLLFNGEDIDVGDDLMAYLGVMEEAQQANGEAVLSQPYKDAS